MPTLKYVVFVFAEEARIWRMAWAWASYLSVDSERVQDPHPGALCVGGLLTPAARSLLLLSVLAKLKSAEGWHIHSGVQTWFKKKIIAASVLSPQLSLDDSSVISTHLEKVGLSCMPLHSVHLSVSKLPVHAWSPLTSSKILSTMKATCCLLFYIILLWK